MSSYSFLLVETKLVFSYFEPKKVHGRIFLGLCDRRFDVGLPRAGGSDVDYQGGVGASWEVLKVKVRPDMTLVLDDDDAHVEELGCLRAWSFLDQR